MRHGRGRRLWVALLAGAGALAAATAADARTETLRWTHPAPGTVRGFHVHVGPASRQYARAIDVGKPAPDANGVYSAQIQVGNTDVVYVSISAYGPGGTSAYSNERLRRPAQTPPPPPGGGSDGGGGNPPPGGGGGGEPPPPSGGEGDLGVPGRPQIILE
jgi:hypothetical protein